MSKSNVLPPNVIGKTRGILEIEILDIIWSVNNKAINKKGVLSGDWKNHYICNSNIIKFIWWGENQQFALQCELNQIKKQVKKHILQYNICTSIKLFYDYLKNCEPIEVQISSRTSNLQIGTAFAKIPENFLQSCLISVSSTTKNQIFSPRNKILGHLVLKMHIKFYESQSNDMELYRDSNTILSKNDQESIFSYPLNINKSYKSFKADKDSNRETVRTGSCSSRIMEYLTGRAMSRAAEEEALNEIHRTSPISNDFYNNFLSFSTSANKSSDKICKIGICEQIDTLRLKLKNIKLLPPGIREVYVDSLVNTTFTVECKISPNLLDNCKSVIRFYSDSYDDKEQRIDFNKEAVRCVKIISNEFDPLIIEHSEILFTIWWRKFGAVQARCLGTTKFRFTNLLNLSDYEQTKKLRIQSCTGGIHVADLICNFKLSSKGINFGSDLMGIIDNTQYRNTCVHELNATSFPSHSSICKKKLPVNKILCERNCSDNMKTIPNSNSDGKDSKTSRSQLTCNVNSITTQSAQSTASGTQCNLNYNNEKDFDEMKSIKNKNLGNFRLLQGLLYVGAVKNLPAVSNGGYFLVCRAFWKEDATSTEIVESDNFNFLEMFPVINDEKFLERTRNNHLKLEIWQKTLETTEHLIGIVRLPLHQFFIAFRDSELTNHLCRAKNPVISIDGWVSIVAPLSGINCGQLQALLAVGTEIQLEELKLKRGISSESVYVNTTNLPRIPVPELTQNNIQHKLNCDASIQTNNNGISQSKSNTGTGADQQAKFTDLLGSFIENLQKTLPLNKSSSNIENKASNQKSITNNHQTQQTVCLTSDLLDVLQKAINEPSTSDTIIPGLIPSNVTSNSMLNTKILLEIEGALHLPRNTIKLVSKKSSAQKRNTNKQNLRFPPNEEPSAYVTFQAVEGYDSMIKSHEGMVYATHIIEKCSNPSWGKRFEIAVPIDMLVNDEKHFILKVWKKAVTCSAQNRLVPTPMEDSIIGFAAIDLTVLMARMPCISGWFNIVDFNGRINGQLKVNVKPLEDVMKFKNNKNCSTKSKKKYFDSNNQFVGDICGKDSEPSIPSLTPTALNLDLNSETSSSTSNDGISDLNNVTLSRAIKRKFTELEEITQRLRARLLDVTGEPEIGAGDCGFLNEIDDDAQIDEFERDLNTVCTDDDEISKECHTNYFNLKEIESTKNVTEESETKKNDDSSRTYVTEGDVQSNSTSNERIQMISNFLKRTQLTLNRNNDVKSPDGQVGQEDFGNNL